MDGLMPIQHFLFLTAAVCIMVACALCVREYRRTHVRTKAWAKWSAFDMERTAAELLSAS